MALVLQGYIPPTFGASVLVALAFFIALGRGVGGDAGRLVRFLFRVGFPLVSLGTLVVTYTGGNYGDVLMMMGGIGSLCLALAGPYVMVSGLFSPSRRK